MAETAKKQFLLRIFVPRRCPWEKVPRSIDSTRRILHFVLTWWGIQNHQKNTWWNIPCVTSYLQRSRGRVWSELGTWERDARQTPLEKKKDTAVNEFSFVAIPQEEGQDLLCPRPQPTPPTRTGQLSWQCCSLSVCVCGRESEKLDKLSVNKWVTRM